MRLFLLMILSFAILFDLNGQSIIKPRGCFAGTNGYQTSVMSHPEARGVLISKRWSEIETAPGVFDFSLLNSNINLVKSAGLKYSLAILGGAVGSPSWLVDSLNAGFITFMFRGSPVNLPFWWDNAVKSRLEILVTALGAQFSQDSSLSHVYVTQMTTNGVEGHLNGLNMNNFNAVGYTDQKWIAAAKWTVYKFSGAFPDIPIVFETHEINQDTLVPATIINDLYADQSLCERIGIGMWWLSGRTDYQSKLITFISSFQGDKYAQVIGRSDQVERFKDSLYSTVFDQARVLGIRYIEPWPYEFQNHTHDNLLHDFNLWTDSIFTNSSICMTLGISENETFLKNKIVLFPNPANDVLNIQSSVHLESYVVSIYNILGEKLLEIKDQDQIDTSNLTSGIYLINIDSGNKNITSRFIKTN